MNHGSRSTYDRLGCRCDLCTAASTASKRLQRERYRSQRGIKAAVADRGRKITLGEVRERDVAGGYGAPIVSGIVVHTLGVAHGDTVEITYGADEIVIRRPRQATNGGEG